MFHGAARYFKKEQREADLLFLLNLKDSHYGCILVQVKGINEKILEGMGAWKKMKYCSLHGFFSFSSPVKSTFQKQFENKKSTKISQQPRLYFQTQAALKVKA